MELLTPLRQLLQRRRVLALGALLSLALALAASGYVPLGPLASPERSSAVATAQIQVDTRRPLVADLRASTATIAEQAVLLGEELAADDNRDMIAASAGVPPRDLAVLSSMTAVIGRASPLARSAVEASSSVQTPVRLTITTPTDTPIISVVAAAPDAPTATRLAAAAAPALQSIIDSAPATVAKRLRVEPLARPRVATIVSGGPRPLIGVLAALIGFVGWCWAAVVLGGCGRLWRLAAHPFAARG